MARIICITSGLTGILNASFELVTRLSSAGHEVVYASPKPVMDRVVAQGINFVQLPGISLQPERENLPSFTGRFQKVQRLKYKIKNAAKRKRAGLAQIDPVAFSTLIDDLQPDLVIIDIELHEYIFKAFAKKIPLVLLSQWFSLWNRVGLPYLLHDTIPGEGWYGKPGAIALSWQWIKWKRKSIFFKKWLTSFGTDRRSSLLALAKQEGFPLEFIKENYWPGPFTYDQLPVMSMTVREMDFPHEERPNHFYIGPMVFEKRTDSFKEKKERITLAEVFHYKATTGRALIYCSVSTLSKGDVLFINKVIAAVKGEKKWMLVLAVGSLLKKLSIGESAENIFTFSHLPQLKVLEQAACSVNHGGIHTINECLHFEVPMLVYSGKKSDQNGCAARVAFHQLGIRADKDKDDVPAIAKNIKEILENRKYKTNVTAMKVQCLKYKKEGFVEQIISGFLPGPIDQK